ncbi:MAG: PAS domain S-box protein [Myxococcales bacterium]
MTRVHSADPLALLAGAPDAARAQLEGEAKSRALLDALPDPVFSFAPDGRFTFSNPAHAAALGRSVEEVVGKNLWDFFPKDEADQLFEVLSEVFRAGREACVEGGPRCGGQARHYQTALRPLADASGQVTSVLCVARDVTERHQAEQELRESERRYRGFFDHLHEAVVVLQAVRDEQGAVVDWRCTASNHAHGRLFGTPSGGLVGTRLGETMGPAALAKLHPRNCRVLTTGETVSEETSVRGLRLVSKVFRLDSETIAVTALDVAEARRAEEALRESESLLRAVIETTADAVYVKDRDSRLLLANPAMLAAIGKPASSVLGHSDDELFDDPAVAEAVLRHDRQVLESGASAVVEEHILTPGGYRTFLSTKSPRRDERGQVVGLVGISRDITDRKQSEQLLQFFVDHAPASLAMFDREMRYLAASRRWLADYRLGGRDLRGLSHYEVFPEIGEAWKQVHRRALAGEVVRADTDRFERADGSVQFLHWEVHPWRDAAGRIGGIVVFTEDVTERVRAERSLRESEERFRSYFESPIIGISMTSPSRGWLEVNARLCEMLGYSEAELKQMTWAQLTHPDDLPADLANFERVRAGAIEGYSMEKRFIHKDGRTIHTDLSARCVRKASGEVDYFVALLQDVTDRKLLETQLRQAQKMESVGRLAGGVAHDFNNMLGVILGHTELALDQVDPGHPLRFDLEEVQKAARRSADLTRQLLAFARKQTVSPKVLELNETITGMLNMLRRLIGEDLRLEWKPGPELWPVRIDPAQIDQILANLCVNARDAISDVGTVTIETENCTFDRPRGAGHAEHRVGEFVRLAVRDDGSGMDAETLAHLFEPFFTTKALGKGTGLGLATVYGIVKQNDGFIDVHSEKGRGTTFTVFLPRHQGADQAAGEAAPGPDLQGNETVLIVEDEPGLLNLTRRMLERQGYRVVAASTPGEALRLAHAHPGEIHLLMTDVVMPEMNGRDLAKNLLAVHPHLRLLFMSGYTSDVIAERGVLEEGTNFIQKPFTAAGLAEKVRAALSPRHP